MAEWHYHPHVDFSVLGPLRVQSDGHLIEVRGAKERIVLAHLIASVGRMVPAPDLIDSLWGEAPPRSASKSLQTFVLRLRNALEPDRGGSPALLVTDGPGYRLTVDPLAVDAERFSRLVALGRRAGEQGRAEACASTFEDALRLWHGPAYVEFQDTAFGRGEGRRLEELRLAAMEERWAAELDRGRTAAATAELDRLVTEHPLRERLWELLILSLYRGGRQSEALLVYERARALLAEELGVDPSPQLRALHQRILVQDPALDAVDAHPVIPPQLTADTTPIVGHSDVLLRLRDAWSRAVDGEAVGVALRGPPGAGASRLAGALAEEVARSGGAVAYTGRGDDADPPDAFQAAAPALWVVDHAPPPPVAGRRRLVLLLASDSVSPPPGYEPLALDPLTAADVRELVRPYVGEDRLEESAATVLRESDGWPGRAHDAALRLSRAYATERVGQAAAVADRSHSALSQARADLADGVTELQGVTRRPLDQDACPWRGLSMYDVADAPWFAGRERLVAELVARVASARLVCVIGASGSGKSSAVRAGLLAALASDVLPGSAAWTQLVMRPGRHPMRELARLALGGQERDVGDLLSRLVLAADGPVGSRTVLLVDQMEELWTSCGDDGERAAFLETLAELAEDEHARVQVVCAIRADFVGALAGHGSLTSTIADATVLVGAPTSDELRRVVERPATWGGLVLDDGLADAIVDDAGSEPGLLPLISTALTQLWDERSGTRLTFAAYVGMGGLNGAIAHLAEEAFAALPEADQALARALFVRLAGPGEGTAVVRRRVPIGEIESLPDEGTARVVRRLAAARLLTLSDGAVEVAHEALFREWPRLHGWLSEDAAGRDVQRRLAFAAAEWDAEGREPGLLWRGARLALALDVAGLHPDEVTSGERAFLDAAQEAVDEEQRAVERRAEATARQNRRLRWLLAGLAMLVVFSMVAATFALLARSDAQRSETSADARRLAATALNEDSPDLALLTALEAVRTERGPDTYGALLTLLSRAPNVITRIRTPDRFMRVAVSPDGQTVYLEENTGVVRAVDAETAEQRWKVQAPVGGPAPLLPSPDGRGVLVVGGPESTATLLDAETGDVRWRLGPNRIAAAQGGGMTFLGDGGGWLSDGRAVVTTGSHLLVVTSDGHVQRAVPWPEPVVYPGRVLVWPDGRISLTLAGDSGAPQPRLLDPRHPDRGFSPLPAPVLAVSPDGRVALVDAGGSGQGGTLRLYDTATMRPISPVVQHTAFVAAASFAPDGQRLVLATEEAVEVRDAETLAALGQVVAHNGSVLGAVFAGLRDDIVWTAGRDGTAAALDLSGRRGVFRTPPIETSPHLGDASAAGDVGLIVTSYDDRPNPAQLVDVATGQDLFGELPIPPRSCLCQVSAVAMAADGHRAVGGVTEFDPDTFSVVQDRGQLMVWSVDDGSVERRIQMPWPVYGVALTPDGTRAVVHGATGLATVDLEAGRVIRTAPEPYVEGSEGLPTVAVAPDGTSAVVARDNRLLFVDPASGRVVRERSLPDRDSVSSITWSADGRALVVGEFTGQIRFLSADDLQPVAPARLIAAGWVAGVEVSRDGTYLATLGTDGDLMLWDAATWTPYGKPLADDHGWGLLSFTGDSSRLRVLYEDRTMLDMSVVPGDWVAAACRAANRDLTPEESAVVRPGEPLDSTCDSMT
jgi:DNA-binding SARP family transcriptional activator/WD40 repeat protein